MRQVLYCYMKDHISSVACTFVRRDMSISIYIDFKN
jgi:hypothetical protein